MQRDTAERAAGHDEPLFGGADRLHRMMAAAHILVIDDESKNLHLIKAMLQHGGYRNVTTLNDARQLEARLDVAQPDLIILDLHMPRRDGFATLEALRPWIVADHLPVLVVTGDSSLDARHRALHLGARDFLTKPFDLTELTLRVRNQLETRLLYQDVRQQNRVLLEAIHGRTQELEESRIETLERLAVAAEYRDDDTSRHTARVGEVSARLAERIGVPAARVRLMTRAAALHDIGKIGIPDALLLKPSRLTEDEMRIMRTHTTIGAHILGGSCSPLLQMAEVIALSHHERWDGEGYPARLAAEAIPLEGRIVAVADTFDALTSDRPYQRAQSIGAALDELAAHRGRQFDASIVDAMVSLVLSGAPLSYATEPSSSAAMRS